MFTSGIAGKVSSPLQGISDDELHRLTERAAQSEQAATLNLLEHLNEVERRRLYAKRAFPSLFEYVRSLGYSEAQSSERVNAARLIRELPEVKEKLEMKSLSLTTASQLQRFFRAEKKAIREKQAKEQVQAESPTEARAETCLADKLKLIEECENKSKREIERLLVSKSESWGRAYALTETKRWVSSDRMELKFQISSDVEQLLTRVQELKGIQSLEQTFNEALKLYVERLESKRGISPRQIKKHGNMPNRDVGDGKLGGARSRAADTSEGSLNSEQQESLNAETSVQRMPTQVQAQAPAPVQVPNSECLTQKSALPVTLKVTSNPTWSVTSTVVSPVPASDTRSRRFTASARTRTWLRSGGQCEYVDPKTQTRCSSRTFLEFDHQLPFALGGASASENARHLCRAHNQLAAIGAFGVRKMSRHLQPR
jgi:hypothetical protein